MSDSDRPRQSTWPGPEQARHAGPGLRPPAMGSTPGQVPGRRRPSARRRGLAVLLALTAIVVPYAIALATVWSSTGEDIAFARLEQDGTVALRPLVALVSATADAQSAAVSGDGVDAAALREAIRAMDAAQARVGEALGSTRRWAGLRSRLEDLLATAPRGAAAYTQFSEAVDVELALITAIGDSSDLVLDPRIDSYYLMDAALLRVPQILADAGRAEDLTWLDEPRKPAARVWSLAAAVAVENVRRSSDAMDAGLRKAFAATTSGTLGPGLLVQLDGLLNAAAQLAPPLSAVGATATPRSARDVQASRTQVRQATLRLEGAALDQLSALLRDRLQAPQDTRRLVLIATLAGLLVAGTVAWVIGPRRASEALPGRGDPDDDERDGPHQGELGGRAGARRTGGPAGGGPDAEAAPSPDDHDLIEARELLQSRRLVRVGRAVTARGAEPGAGRSTDRSATDGGAGDGGAGAGSPGPGPGGSIEGTSMAGTPTDGSPGDGGQGKGHGRDADRVREPR